jgi:hypothetical protein
MNVSNTEIITRKLAKKGIYTGISRPLKKCPIVSSPSIDIRLNISLKRYHEKTYISTNATINLSGCFHFTLEIADARLPLSFSISKQGKIDLKIYLIIFSIALKYPNSYIKHG